MSRENVEAVLGALDAWNRGDRDGWLAPTHPEIEWSSAILRQVEGAEGARKGRAELQRFWDEWHALWSMEIEVSETRDRGDTVVVLARLVTTGKASGAEVGRSVGYVFEFEDGLIRRARAYLSPGEALEAVGLREYAMSRENVELHSRALDAFNRRDLDAFLALMDPNVEANSRLAAIEGGYHGHDGIRRWWANLLDTIPDWTLEIVEVRDLGDLTLAVLRNRGHGAGSEIPLEQALWQVAEWRDKKVVRWTSHETQAEAPEAVGLRDG